MVTELALGIAGLLVVNWLVAWAGWLSQNGAVAVFGAGALLNLLKMLPNKSVRRGERETPIVPWAVLLQVPGFVLLLIAACCPPGSLWRVEAFGYDVTSYHLQLPREWLNMGHMVGLEHNVYSFLPSLIESGYLLIGVLSGSVLAGMYTCQLFHVTLALLAAAAIGKTVTVRTTTPTGIGAAALFLAVPWVTVTGSIAYNEMGVMAFGAAALMLTFNEAGTTRRGAAAIGILVGAATLSKLTAGVMVALPVGLILLFGLNRNAFTHSPNSPARKGGVNAAPTSDDVNDSRAQPRPSGRGYVFSMCLQSAGIAALAGFLTLSPYFIRNYNATGNPVFPFAADSLGVGHWDETLVERWDTAHGLSPKHEGKLDALGRQWLFNTGFGAVGGHVTPRETQNMARFDREGGVPPLWIAVVIAGVLLLIHKDTRRPAGALLMMLGVQVLFWMFATHMQSRFLLPTLLPACLIVGLGYDRLHTITKPKAPTAAPLLGSAVIITLAVTGYATLASQTRTVPDPQTGEPLQLPIWSAIDAPIDNADHPINRLPEKSRTLLVADNSGLLYLDRPFVYATAFDEDPLGRIIRATSGDPHKVNRALHAAGITHVWVHWAELDRLHNTYGHDRDVTPQTLEKLIATDWQPIESVGRSATLYVLP
jgi:4-amino-4-deoxy-L-arabinose transferase-like glycosyltransferase